MNALIRTELLRLWTARSTRALLAAGAALGMLQVARIVRSAGSAGGIHPGSGDAWAQILGAGMSGSLLVLLVGVLAVTADFRHGSLTPILLVTPRRARVMAARMVSCALAGASTATLMALASAAAGLATGALGGAPGSGVLLSVAGGVLLAAFWGWAGAAIGLLVRHQITALVLPLVWLLVVETLAGAYGIGPVRWWLPGGAGAGLTGSTAPGVLPAWLAVLVLVSYGTALTVPGIRRLARADIT